jgi:hypothetical protein
MTTPVDDIRTLIARSRLYDEFIDATEIAMSAQKLFPSYELGELVSMVVEEAAFVRAPSASWPKAGPHSL